MAIKFKKKKMALSEITNSKAHGSKGKKGYCFPNCEEQGKQNLEATEQSIL